MNKVSLRGKVNVRKSFPARDDLQALVFASITPAGEKAWIDVKAFGKAAEALGNAHELTVECEGHLAGAKPEHWKPGDKTKWPLVVVIEKVVEVAPRGHELEEPF